MRYFIVKKLTVLLFGEVFWCQFNLLLVYKKVKLFDW